MTENKNITVPFRVLCTDSDLKPDAVDDDEWIIEGSEEIVTEVFTDLISGDQSYKILGKDPDPYRGFRGDRFMVMSTFSVN